MDSKVKPFVCVVASREALCCLQLLWWDCSTSWLQAPLWASWCEQVCLCQGTSKSLRRMDDLFLLPFTSQIFWPPCFKKYQDSQECSLGIWPTVSSQQQKICLQDCYLQGRLQALVQLLRSKSSCRHDVLLQHPPQWRICFPCWLQMYNWKVNLLNTDFTDIWGSLCLGSLEGWPISTQLSDVY